MGLEWEDSIEQDGQADVTSQAVNIPSVRPCSLRGHFARSLAKDKKRAVAIDTEVLFAQT